ncbi:hypothetical protein G9G39_22425 [Cronobacter sp. EKM101R]|uniref:hypothetical protein n=1 Tax=Cronobacter TaxID=413496 RepID=UPI0013EB0589|nr:MULTISPECIES: hypothetical protein [Cronobacter]KAF6589136.1 hypothetical protein G9G39_22425 [Cronobacter sp. EKM101R]KAF6592392.1 hypothetical protein G9G38_22610 [Cronobacter sp. EKM102R]MDK1186571.1 hypothetical protein [Cronobacter turicensis]MDK1208234.1 hypothetical protein [Cronobacter turicensis]MDK1216575.1 hypothetical protein [Cronobacter turicensis]
MNEKELIAALSVPGCYEVVTREDGSFVVIPIPPDVILISWEAHTEAIGYFCSKKE